MTINTNLCCVYILVYACIYELLLRSVGISLKFLIYTFIVVRKNHDFPKNHDFYWNLNHQEVEYLYINIVIINQKKKGYLEHYPWVEIEFIYRQSPVISIYNY